MKEWLKKLFTKESFEPSFLGLLINHFYIVRRGLLKGIELLSEDLNGGRLLDFGCGSQPYRHFMMEKRYPLKENILITFFPVKFLSTYLI